MHAKGVLILSSFLAARYSRFQPHSIVGSLVFEQTYGLVEGDSASLAELVALLASIGDVPVRQCLGDDRLGRPVRQRAGDRRASTRRSRASSTCAWRAGSTARTASSYPQSNVAQLMLRDDVVAAVAGGRFALHAVRTVDDALEVLTGLAAGDAGVPSDDTVNGRIAKRLREYTTIRRGEPRFMRHRGPRTVRVVDRQGRTHERRRRGGIAGACGARRRRSGPRPRWNCRRRWRERCSRVLSVVYVESARSLVAAALPFTQVLSHFGVGLGTACCRWTWNWAFVRTRLACGNSPSESPCAMR